MTDDTPPDGLPPPAPGPSGLPTAKVKTKARAIDAGRYCQGCGGEARVHSGPNGVRGHCAKCKTSWTISGPLASVIYPAPERGISKQTYVQPDFDSALEDLDGDDEWKPDGD